MVTAPTLTAFAASALTSHQGPFTFSQCSTLTWTSTAGDPAATWALAQSGYYVSVLPSPLHLGPGQSGQRVCIHDTVHSGQNTTTLTLTGMNEAGTVSRSATITWAGGVVPGCDGSGGDCRGLTRALRVRIKAMKRDPEKSPQAVNAYYAPRIEAEQAKRRAAGLPEGGRTSRDREHARRRAGSAGHPAASAEG